MTHPDSSAKANRVRYPEAYDAFAVVAPGLEALALAELRGLGARGARQVDGGVEFRSSKELLYRANLESRVVSRVIVRVAEFSATSFPELERRLRRVNWGRWIAPSTSTRVRVTCRKSKLYHSDAVAERVTRVMAEAIGLPPEVEVHDDEERPDTGFPKQLLLVRILHDRCTLSLDSSGHLLHMRGYRLSATKAPLRETLAAAMVIASLSSQHSAIIDPMCGSGTLLIEAAMLLRRIPPGRGRGFSFESWPDTDHDLWSRVRERSESLVRPRADIPIIGSDRDAGAVQSAIENAERAGVSNDIEFSRRTVSALEAPPGLSSGLVITNPPYGVRVGDRDGLRDLYARFGTVLRERFSGWTIAILSADRRLESQLRIQLKDRMALSNGGIRVRLLTGVA